MLFASFAKGQFLFSESFVTIPLDTTKKTAGMISGSFNQQTQKNIVTQIGSRFEFAHRLKGVHVLTLAGNFQVVRNGNENVLSGGYYLEDLGTKSLEISFLSTWPNTNGMKQGDWNKNSLLQPICVIALLGLKN